MQVTSATMGRTLPAVGKSPFESNQNVHCFRCTIAEALPWRYGGSYAKAAATVTARCTRTGWTPASNASIMLPMASAPLPASCATSSR